jgi:hypothetical protein
MAFNVLSGYQATAVIYQVNTTDVITRSNVFCIEASARYSFNCKKFSTTVIFDSSRMGGASPSLPHTVGLPGESNGQRSHSRYLAMSK